MAREVLCASSFNSFKYIPPDGNEILGDYRSSFNGHEAGDEEKQVLCSIKDVLREVTERHSRRPSQKKDQRPARLWAFSESTQPVRAVARTRMQVFCLGFRALCCYQRLPDEHLCPCQSTVRDEIQSL